MKSEESGQEAAMAVEWVATKIRLPPRFVAQEMEQPHLRYGMEVGFGFLDAHPRPGSGQHHLGHDGHERPRAETHLVHRINQVFILHQSYPSVASF